VTWRIRIAALTHPGRVRKHNEDCFAIGNWVEGGAMAAPLVFERDLDASLVCLVADGMGGHVGGRVASEFVATNLPAPLAACGSDVTCITKAIRDVNARLYACMLEDPSLRGMGAVVAGLVLGEASVVIFSVGDSRVYEARDGQVAQLSVDDLSEPPELIAAGGMSSGILTQSVGGAQDYRDIEPHVSRQIIGDGATILICSDGLHDLLTDAEIGFCLSQDLTHTVGRLFHEAMQAGGRDNVTIMLLQIERAASDA
jgi:serine/threonine protein phosphatase PrpC